MSLYFRTESSVTLLLASIAIAFLISLTLAHKDHDSSMPHSANDFDDYLKTINTLSPSVYYQLKSSGPFAVVIRNVRTGELLYTGHQQRVGTESTKSVFTWAKNIDLPENLEMNGVWVMQVIRHEMIESRALMGQSLATVRISNAAMEGEYLDAGDDLSAYDSQKRRVFTTRTPSNSSEWLVQGVVGAYQHFRLANRRYDEELYSPNAKFLIVDGKQRNRQVFTCRNHTHHDYEARANEWHIVPLEI